MYFKTLQWQYPPRGFMHPSKHCIDKTPTKNTKTKQKQPTPTQEGNKIEITKYQKKKERNYN